MELSIVIVSWNVTGPLERCLASIQTHLGDVSHEVIVIDNCGVDNPEDMITRRFPATLFLRNARNEGFAIANNQGFAMATGRHVLILNPDTVVEAGAVQRMLAVLEQRPEVWMVGPRVVEADGSPVRACKRPNMSLREIAKGLFLTDKAFHWIMKKIFGQTWLRFADQSYYQSSATECIQGSCMLMRRAQLNELQGFDERVPMYLDDGDLCARVRKRGHIIWYDSEAVIGHQGAASVGRMKNPRMSSMVGSLAVDAFFYKHRGLGAVRLYHAMLCFSSLIFLAADLVLWPLWRAWDPAFIPNYWEKHRESLRYSLTHRFETDTLPDHWPRSVRSLYCDGGGAGD